MMAHCYTEFPGKIIQHMKKYAGNAARMYKDIMVIPQLCLLGIPMLLAQKTLFIDVELVAKSGRQWI